MITCLLGTRAQLIKMAPIMIEIERRDYPLQLFLTGQHRETMSQLLADFQIRTAPVALYDGPEVNGIGKVLPWFSACLWRAWRRRRQLFPGSSLERRNSVVLVHGDTFSTLLGALIGRLTGQQVAHVEAGLRSFNLLHPFPEELTRLAVFRLSHLAYCPDDWALSNLRGYSVRGVNTGGNTLLDALRLAVEMDKPLPEAVPEKPFCVVSLHRFENIFRQERLLQILELLEETAERYPLVFVLHPATRRNLEKFSLFDRLASNQSIHLWPRMGYFEFVGLLVRSKFVITDGGSNQEELSYLGKPTLLMRKATERQEGLDGNTVLCGYDRDVLRRFLDRLDSLCCEASMPTGNPSACIVDALRPYIGRRS